MRRYRPDWKALYARQKKELANLKRMQQRAGDKLRKVYRDEEQVRDDRAVRRLYSARNPQPVPGPLRAPKGRRPSEQEKRQARGVTRPPSGAVRAGDWLRADKENRSGYLREAFELSTLWAIELAQRHKKERAELSADHKNKLAVQLSGIKHEYTQRRTALRDKQKEESRALTERHLNERQQAARDLREGRDKEEFLDENRAKRTAEFERTKDDIERPKTGAGKPKLSELVKRATSAGRDAAEQQSGRGTPDKRTQFREQANETTRSPAGKGTTKLADQVKKARGEAGRDTPEIFRDNANDVSQDQGRERSRHRKPPGSKPD